jgi:hypothetical protein
MFGWQRAFYLHQPSLKGEKMAFLALKKTYLFTIRKTDTDNSAFSWMRIIALFNDLFERELWGMEVGYAAKLIVIVTTKDDLTLEHYISTFEAIARTGLIEEKFDYEEKKPSR